ncbi:MAG TPA: hypothetical protein VGE72_05930 [Azospirillum sp.]
MQPAESTSTDVRTPEVAKPVREVFAGAFSGGGASGGLFVGAALQPRDEATTPPASGKR